jgi:hypothetical protein
VDQGPARAGAVGTGSPLLKARGNGESRRFRPFECHTGERAWNRQQAAPNIIRVAERHPNDVDTPRAAVPRLILASLLFAVALVPADGPILLTAVLPGVPALLAVGLGDGERAVS